jgi:hypothetical protein
LISKTCALKVEDHKEETPQQTFRESSRKMKVEIKTVPNQYKPIELKTQTLNKTQAEGLIVNIATNQNGSSYNVLPSDQKSRTQLIPFSHSHDKKKRPKSSGRHEINRVLQRLSIKSSAKDGGMTVQKPSTAANSNRDRRELLIVQNLNKDHLERLASPKFCEEAKRVYNRRSRVSRVQNTQVKFSKRSIYQRF